MIENYIDQIITMKILADGITIIDDKGIIKYFKVFRDDTMPFSFSEVAGKHFLDVFPEIKKEESTVLKALNGEPTFDKITYQRDFKGGYYPILESVYPIKIKNNIIGVVCISRNTKKSIKSIDIKTMDMKQSEIFTLNDLIGISPKMQELKIQIIQLAETNANVLVYGETGTGKEMVAQSIHSFSNRKNKTFFSLNCAAIPETLSESIFFGSKKGIYTGSVDRPGILEQADGGTVFLDEINSLELSIQAKLLKSLEEKKVRRLGSDKLINTDIRIISAMNENPFSCLKSRKIRSDLFYRLGTVMLRIPPLRERKEDIPILTDYFIQKCNKESTHQIIGVSPTVEEIFQNYNWPGNVRELSNAIESAFIFAKSSLIEVEDIPSYITGVKIYNNIAPEENDDLSEDSLKKTLIETFIEDGDTLKDSVGKFEAALLKYHLNQCSNRSELARKLKISRQTLLNKLNKYGL